MERLKPKYDSWNLDLLYSSDKDPAIEKDRKKIKKINYGFINKWKQREDYLTDIKALKEALDELEYIERNFGSEGREGFYFGLKSSLEEDNPSVKARLAKIDDFSRRIDNDSQFFELRLAAVPKKTQKLFLSSKELKEYRHYLFSLFESSKYLLSEPEEKIMNLKSNASYSNWVRMTSVLLSKQEREVLNESGGKDKKNFSEIINLIDSKEKKIRDSAAAAFNGILEKYAEIAESELNSILEDKKVNDELRKMKRPDEGRHHSDDISSKVVDTLIESVSSGYSIAKRYYSLKAKLMGVEKLAYHERNVEYGKITKRYPYEDALNLVYDVYYCLDPEFASILKMFNENGQIDIYPKKGKKHGAFCTDSLVSLPTFVLLNHDGSLNDVLTLAHEMGHAINSELIKKKQNSLNFGTSLATAEVASTFMEEFVLNDILKKSSGDEKLSIMMMKLNNDISSIFRQAACYRFEKELHEEFREIGYLSSEHIGRIFLKHMKSYMGDSVEYSKGCENWWVYWSHIRHFFYVYSYASGVLISKSMVHSVKKDHGFVEKVNEFLSMGRSDSAENAFKKMGIDITKKEFWKNGLAEIEALLDETEKYAKELGKI